MSPCVIDMYWGATYDKARHFVPEIFWSDDSLRYWGWIYDAREPGKIVGDFTAQTVQDASRALGVKFVCD